MRIRRWLGGGLVLLVLLSACQASRAVRLPWGEEVYDVIFSPSGEGVLVLSQADDDVVAYRSLPRGNEQWRVEGLYGRLFAGFAPDGSEVAVYSEGRLLFYDVGTGDLQDEIDLRPRERLGYRHPLYAALHIAYRPDGELALLVQHRDSYVLERWSREGRLMGDPVPLSHEKYPVYWQPFTRDGEQVAFLTQDGLGLLDIASGERRTWAVEAALPDARYLNCVASDPEGETLIAGLADLSYLHDVRPNRQGMLVRVDGDSGEILARYDLPEAVPPGDSVMEVAYRPPWLVAQTLDAQALLLYDVSASTPTVLCAGDDCCRQAPAISPDGSTLATVCGRNVRLWSLGEED